MLPKQLEVTLKGLLDTSVLTSWTIHGNEKITSLTIRFSPDTVAIADNIDIIPIESAKYKRVPQTQLQRDKTRAADRNNNCAVDKLRDVDDEKHNIKDTEISQKMSSATVVTPKPVSTSAPSRVTRSKQKQESTAKPIHLSAVTQVDGATDERALLRAEPSDVEDFDTKYPNLEDWQRGLLIQFSETAKALSRHDTDIL